MHFSKNKHPSVQISSSNSLLPVTVTHPHLPKGSQYFSCRPTLKLFDMLTWQVIRKRRRRVRPTRRYLPHIGLDQLFKHSVNSLVEQDHASCVNNLITVVLNELFRTICSHVFSHVFSHVIMCIRVFSCFSMCVMCSRVFACVCICSRVFACVCICSRVFACVCICFRVFSCVCVCSRVFSCVCICSRVFSCVYLSCVSRNN